MEVKRELLLSGSEDHTYSSEHLCQCRIFVGIRAASSVEPALEIRLGRGLKVLLGSLMPPVSCTSVLLQYSFLQLFHEVYLSLHVSRVQSMKGRRHKLHL